jgi:signal transduction histidine kinase
MTDTEQRTGGPTTRTASDVAWPTRRAPVDETGQALTQGVGDLAAASFSTDLLDAIAAPVVVTNPERQIVFANQAAKSQFRNGQGWVVGAQPGDLIGCAHLDDTPSGCGTGAACRSCGLLTALLGASEGHAAVRDAQLLLATGESIDATVTVSPLAVGERSYYLCEIRDTSGERRRQQLERAFFHDLLNVASAIKGLIDVGRQVGFGSDPELVDALHLSSEQLVDEINLQRSVSEAESGDLTVHPEPADACEVLASAVSRVSAIAQERSLRFEIVVPDHPVGCVTDPTILGRVLGNLLKNAAEATASGGVVRAELSDGASGVRFSVHNDAWIPPAIQRQLFHRSFSTKGPDRGVGTFASRLLTERYLDGTIGFVSDRASGTTFSVTIPAGSWSA